MKFFGIPPHLFAILFCLLLPASSYGQNVFQATDTVRQSLVIDTILIEGNERTSRTLIKKLIEIEQGDTIYFDRLFLSMQSSRFHLVRTGLFQDVTITLQDLRANHANLHIELNEKSLLSPLGTVELADRNISEWWVEHRFSLRRLTVGGGAAVNNWLGLGEQFGLYGLIGLNQGIHAYYTIPYFTPESAWGGSVNINWSRNRIFGISNDTNRLQYFETEDFGLRKRHADAGISYRPNAEIITRLNASYNHHSITAEVFDNNPNFFGDHQKHLRYLSVGLSFEINKTDHYSYPLNGTRFKISARKNGLNILGEVSQDLLKVEMNHYQRWDKKLYSAHTIDTRISRGESNNFYLQRAFGYGDHFLRSYELSVIRGEHFFLTQNDLKYRLAALDFIPPSYMQWLYKVIPFDLYVKFLLDGGIVVNDSPMADNKLANEFLLGYGLGLDFVFLNQYVAAVHFSINRENQKGIYLHLNW